MVGHDVRKASHGGTASIRRVSRLSFALLASFLALSQTAPQTARRPILDYIKQTWPVLARSNQMLATAAVDPKFPPPANGVWPVYVARDENLSNIDQQLRRDLSAADFRKISLHALPANLAQLREQGLLYLPHPYVVPGGRFNEMYGWDSYFIQLGLLRDGESELAKDMAENFLYEIRNYGRILNANRTYYLTRSQPPFLTQMLLGVYAQTHDRKWLQNAVPAIEKYYQFWTTAPHLTPETSLSRYYDLGDGPAPEVLSSEKNADGVNHYDLVKQYFRTHQVADYDVGEYYDKGRDILTTLFYKGDRSMRESGFDPSDRFGKFNIDIIHYDPVCLNSLLYLMERQTAEIMKILNRTSDVATWDKRATERSDRINRFLWDQQAGLYFDYEFVHLRQRKYPFATTFLPLWAGVASREQAAAVVRNLPLFEKPGGLQTSTTVTGNQWDAPFAWAPLQLFAVEGLRRYGYNAEADRVSTEFLSMVLEQYREHGIIVEKYDAVRRSMDVNRGIQFGYSSNEAGFGWTNAVFTALYDALPAKQRSDLMAQ
ncbi:MAG TPA: trehalase family glycosidase [Bryobacteraceae bacterium]|nr:trehalase family glycosidase [Bryobacteraceae bacterium]